MMKTVGCRRVLGVLTATTATVFGAHQGVAQETLAGGTVQEFGISSSLRANDNFDLDDSSDDISTIWDSGLSYGLSSSTPRDVLEFSTSATLRRVDDSDAELVSPLASLAYARTGANSEFGAQLRYSQLDLDFQDPANRIDDDVASASDDNLIDDTGLRQTIVVGVDFETGLQRNFGTGLALNYSRVTYSDVTDPGLFDIETSGQEVFGRFRFSPVTEGTLTFSQQQFDAEDVDQTSRVTQSASFALQYALSPITSVNAQVGGTVVEQTNNVSADVEETGATGRLALTRSLTRGDLNVSLDTSLSVNGRRSTLSVSRNLPLPNGEIVATAGVTQGVTDEVDPFGSLTFSREGLRTTLTGQIESSFQTSIRGEETETRRAAIDYDVQINTLSSMSFGFDYAEVRVDGEDGATDRNVGTLSAAYTYALTRNWGLAAGYEYTRSEDEDVNDSNEVFLKVSRDFSGR